MNSPAPWMDPRLAAILLAAVVSAVVTVLGWFVAFRRDDRAQARRRADEIANERRRRLERRLDFQIAIRAEIWANIYQLEADDLEADADAKALRFSSEKNVLGRSRPWMPLIVREKRDMVFEALVNEIQILPSETIRPVIFYYSTIRAAALFAEDLRDPGFALRSAEVRALAYRDYIDMKKKALEFGQEAVEALTAEIENLRADPGLNSPGAAPSGLI